MSAEPKSTPDGRFLIALQMADFGIALMRENLRRRFPDESEEELHARMATWLEGPEPTAQDLKAHDLRGVPWPR